MTTIFCMRKERSPIYLGWVLIMVKAVIDFKKLAIAFFGIVFPYQYRTIRMIFFLHVLYKKKLSRIKM